MPRRRALRRRDLARSQQSPEQHRGSFRGRQDGFKESLARLRAGKVKILYLVTRDNATPIESTLSAVQELHDEGLFEEFGVSNFSAWQVAEASENSRAPWLDKAERLPGTVQRDHACGRTRIIQMPRQLRHPFPCLQSAGRRRLQQEFWRWRCGRRRLAFRQLTWSGQAISRSLLERRLSRCFGANSPILRRPWSRRGLGGVALADSSLPTKRRTQ
jgi:aryl-alcohol dehydrogenase-like predicted oxidoreductase